MHQTFYIDIDEEITSIVERLKKTRADEVILVVPKRALLIQSIVNLRILKKEADQIKLQLMIVTQDKLGKLLIEKAGILVQQNMDDIPEEEIKEKSTSETFGSEWEREAAKGGDIHAKKAQKGRLDSMGTDSYFDEKGISREMGAGSVPISAISVPIQKEERIVNKELVSDISSDMRRIGENHISLRMGDNARKLNDISQEKKTFPSMDVSKNVETKKEIFERPEAETQKVVDPYEPKDKKIDDFFHHAYDGNFGKKENISREEPAKQLNLPSGFKKFFIAFGLMCAIVFLAAVAYLFIPKATVNITLKTEAKSIDSEIKGLTSAQEIDYENEIIPVKLVSTDQTVTQTFAVSGSKSASNQKAHGTIAIYNEFSSSSQTLVATTRFLSENGKMFRLIKSVVVPGTVNVNGEIKPGVIEAEVSADSPGEEYNVGPTKFTIPGFKDSGSDKYNKFYAKSTKAMEGGGSSQGGVRIISDEDIANAKTGLLDQINEAVRKKILESAGDGMVVLDDAINKEEITYKLSNSLGEVADNFQITGQMKATAFVFREDDIKTLSARIISKFGDVGNEIDSESVSLEFGKANADIKAESINIKLHASGKVLPKIDFDNLRKEIAGKSDADLEEYLRTYPEIEKVEMTYYPAFLIGRMPFRESQIELKVDLL